MTIDYKGECASCDGDKPALSWAQVGEDVLIRGGSVGDTRYTHFQCGDCGEMWVKVTDIGGIRGPGTYYHKMDSHF